MGTLTGVLLTLALAQVLPPAAAAQDEARRVVAPGLVIAGQVFDQSGRPFAGASVYAIFENQRPGTTFASTQSRAGGEFVLRVREPGRYTVVADKSRDSRDEGYAPQNLPFFRHPGSTADVTVAAGRAVRGVQLRLAPKNGAVEGRVFDASTGLPVDSVRLRMCHVERPLVCYAGYTWTRQGALQLAAAHVPFTLRIEADDYEAWFAPDGAGEGVLLSVPSGETLRLEVALRRRAESIGKAIDESEKQAGVHLPAPAQLSPADGAVFDHFPRSTRLEWSPVVGAASYRVEVDFCEGREDRRHGCSNPAPFANSKQAPPSARLQGTTFEFDFVGAQPGRWRVWAVDAEGREGFKSPWRRFVYQR